MRSSCNGRGTASMSATLRIDGCRQVVCEQESSFVLSLSGKLTLTHGYVPRNNKIENGRREPRCNRSAREETGGDCYTHLGRCSWGTGVRSSRSVGPRSRTKSIHFGDETRSFCLPGMSRGGAPSGGSVGSTQLMEASSILRAQRSTSPCSCLRSDVKRQTIRGSAERLLCCRTRRRCVKRQASVTKETALLCESNRKYFGGVHTRGPTGLTPVLYAVWIETEVGR